MTSYGSTNDSSDDKELGLPAEEVECKEWRRPEQAGLLSQKGGATAGGKEDEDEDAQEEETGDDQKSVCVAMFTLVISVPALIGMWCWPALVIPLLGGTVTSASRHMSHFLNLSIDLLMLGGVTALIWYEACTKRRSSLSAPIQIVYGPAWLVSVASILILADPLRHVLQDLHLITASMYIHNCSVRALQIPARSCSVAEECGSHYCGGAYYSVNPGEDCFTCLNDGMCSEGAETFTCLSAIGWFVTVVCTYVGFALFFVGVMWNSNLIYKISKTWKSLRAKSAA
jgi:hypothetical protein